MDIKREKPEYDDIEDRRGKPVSKRPAKKDLSHAQKIERKERADQKYRDTVIKEIGRKSKNSDEFNKRVSEFEKNLSQYKKDSEESDRDAVRAWSEGFGKNESPKMKAALKDISDTTKRFGNKKFRNPESYAHGGVVRGFGKARGAKPVKVC